MDLDFEIQMYKHKDANGQERLENSQFLIKTGDDKKMKLIGIDAIYVV